jgi:hypothetical protein
MVEVEVRRHEHEDDEHGHRADERDQLVGVFALPWDDEHQRGADER